jgi:hypothetical protein
MSASTASTRGDFGRRARMLILGAMVACLGVFALAGPAKAAPVSMELTNGQLNLGFAFSGAEILPSPPALGAKPDADPPVPGTPLPDLWQARDTLPATCLAQFLDPPDNLVPNPNFPCGANPPSATVSGEVTDGAVTITSSPGLGLPSGFRFPIMELFSPLPPNAPVPVTIASPGNVTGTFDSATGEVSLSGPIEARVLVGLASNPFGQYCAVPLTDLTLSTTSNADFPGVPFTSGFDGAGALTGTFNINTDDNYAVGGADCAAVDSAVGGIGSIWLSSNIAEPPVCDEFTTGVPPNCQPIPCEPGFTGNEPNCVQLKARIGSVTVSGPNRIRNRKPATYKVKIRNSGNAQATGVRLVAAGRGIRVNVPVKAINPGVTRTVRLTVRARNKGRIKATFKVTSNNAGSRTVRKTIRVR